MTYRELTMIDVREVLRRWGAGHSNRQIARETGTHRNTVGRYIDAAAEVGLERVDAGAVTDAVVHQVAQRVQARALPERSQECPSTFLHHSCAQPFLDESHESSISDPMLDEFH